MITGFNHNIKYKDIVFHIQTEDSGEEKAHIISHLFIGGNIIITIKNSYKNVINAPAMREVVKNMMKLQHKSVLKNLLNAQYDQEIDAMLGHISSHGKLSAVQKDVDVDILSQSESKTAAHLVEDKQKTILEKNKKSTESNLDDLILSFLEDNL